ncbi:hypothetical protein DACRYDRAFT_42973, partial [Dacryopinax primogenitus]
HMVCHINYTTYNVQCAQDTIHVGKGQCDIMLPSGDDSMDSHPYWYAQVICIFHVNLTHQPTNICTPQQHDVLLVRWLAQEDTNSTGSQLFQPLDRVSWVSGDNEDGNGFVDPSSVICSCHLVPCFNSG